MSRAATLLTLAVSLSLAGSRAHAADDDVASRILGLDAEFWQAYNTCDVPAFARFFTEKVEFYHDKGGPTFGRDTLLASVKTGLCGNPHSRIRREAVDGSVKLFLLRNQGAVYGAVLTGEHYFYVRQDDKPEFRDGLAKFTHLWLMEDGAWRMARALSYDHGPAPYVSARTVLSVPESALDACVGNYRGPHSGAVAMTRAGATLVLTAGGHTMTLYPESASVFFAKERDLTFEFVRDAKGAVVTMRVRENGSVVEEAARVE